MNCSFINNHVSGGSGGNLFMYSNNEAIVINSFFLNATADQSYGGHYYG